MIVCCNFAVAWLMKSTLAENMKVKRPIEDTRLRSESKRDHYNLIATLLYGYIGEFNKQRIFVQLHYIFHVL